MLDAGNALRTGLVFPKDLASQPCLYMGVSEAPSAIRPMFVTDLGPDFWGEVGSGDQID